MPNKELSKIIRESLKDAGFSNRKDYRISVKSALYDTAVNITVINPLVRISEIEKITSKFSEIDYDEHTQEILAGCNVYVHCQYDYGIFDEVTAPLLPVAKNVFNSEKYDGRKIAENEKVEIHLIKINDVEKRLAVFGKGEKVSGDSYILHYAEDLAVAMWRFKNLGTIYS